MAQGLRLCCIAVHCHIYYVALGLYHASTLIYSCTRDADSKVEFSGAWQTVAILPCFDNGKHVLGKCKLVTCFRLVCSKLVQPWPSYTITTECALQLYVIDTPCVWSWAAVNTAGKHAARKFAFDGFNIGLKNHRPAIPIKTSPYIFRASNPYVQTHLPMSPIIIRETSVED